MFRPYYYDIHMRRSLFICKGLYLLLSFHYIRTDAVPKLGLLQIQKRAVCKSQFPVEKGVRRLKAGMVVLRCGQSMWKCTDKIIKEVIRSRCALD